MSIVMISTDHHYVLFSDTEIDSSRGANIRCAVCAVMRKGCGGDSGKADELL